MGDCVMNATDPRIRRVELATLATNTRALSFYESLGFVREGAQQGYVSGSDDA
jgi:ribosomal protein S18 acetylase RimI-like enzyme